MILVDSSVWIDYFSGLHTPQADRLDELLGKEVIAVGDLIYTEVLQGFGSDTDFQTARRLLDTLLFLEMGGKEIALQSALNYRFLRERGITVRKTIDMFIATFCIARDLPLLHSDKDFDLIAEHLGLRVVV